VAKHLLVAAGTAALANPRPYLANRFISIQAATSGTCRALTTSSTPLPDGQDGQLITFTLVAAGSCSAGTSPATTATNAEAIWFQTCNALGTARSTVRANLFLTATTGTDSVTLLFSSSSSYCSSTPPGAWIVLSLQGSATIV